MGAYLAEPLQRFGGHRLPFNRIGQPSRSRINDLTSSRLTSFFFFIRNPNNMFAVEYLSVLVSESAHILN